MINKFAAIATAILLLEGAAFAQEKYVYLVDVSDKTLNVGDLDLPGSTPLIDIIALIPELLKNADQTVGSVQYDILVEGISVDCAANSVLNHMHLSDIKSISVSESPAASQQKNGSGGVIDISLNDAPEGFSGRASVNAATSSDFRESAMLNFRKDKLTIRSWLMLDTSTPGFRHEYRTLSTDHGAVYCIDTTRTRSYYQMGRLYADYNPSSKDTFKFRFWESSQSSDNIKYMQMVPTGENDAGGSNKSRSATVSATLSYTHDFSQGHSISAQFDYLYLPEYGVDERRNPFNIDAEPSRKVETLTHGHNWLGALSYKVPLIVKDGKNLLNFKTGVNLTAKSAENEYSEKVNFASLMLIPSNLSGDIVTRLPERSLYISPYIEFGGGGDKLKYKASARYQHYESTTDPGGGDKTRTTFKNDITGNLSVGWQMTPHQHLRLILDHGIIRPSNWQMYPLLVYRPDKSCYIIGNPELHSSTLNSINLNYITDFQIRNSNFVVNGSAGLIHADGLLSSTYGTKNVGMLLPYMSYENSGTSNILKADFLCSLINGPLTLSLAANFFDKLQKTDADRDYRIYYNCAFGSSYRITPDWTLFAELMYNSPVLMPTIESGSCLYGNLRVSKTWERLEAFAVVTNILHKARWEVAKSAVITTYRYYDLYPSSIILGFSYLF